jgi:hypothetical protein
MTEGIKFWGEQGSLVMEVYGYERPTATNKDDANCLRCAMTMKAGPFAGTFDVAFTTYDFVKLRDDLKKALAALSGTISFQNTEGDVAFDIEFNKRGGASLRGTAHPHRWLEASLQFRLDTDQSALAQTLGQLEAVLRKLPVR